MTDKMLQQCENMAAILDWYSVNRPDLLEQVERLLQANESMRSLVGAAFDAGRCFQYANPACPLGPIMPGGNWERIIPTIRDCREGEVKAKVCSCGGISTLSM